MSLDEIYELVNDEIAYEYRKLLEKRVAEVEVLRDVYHFLRVTNLRGDLAEKIEALVFGNGEGDDAGTETDDRQD